MNNNILVLFRTSNSKFMLLADVNMMCYHPNTQSLVFGSDARQELYRIENISALEATSILERAFGENRVSLKAYQATRC